MNTEDVVKDIAKASELTQTDVHKVLKALPTSIGKALDESGEFTLFGIGKFKAKFLASRDYQDHIGGTDKVTKSKERMQVRLKVAPKLAQSLKLNKKRK